jgi:adenine phosphoribosyltransferase
LIATGGTAEAAIRLIEKVGGNVVGCSFIIDLPELKGRERLEKLGKQVLSLVEFEGH